jgi:hypothetical protein
VRQERKGLQEEFQRDHPLLARKEHGETHSKEFSQVTYG